MPADYRAGLRTLREEVTGESLPVDGAFPDWLRGRFLGNGPGQFEVGGRPLVHWFDPLAMLRGFTFDEGVTYANRFVRSRDFAYAREKGKVRTPFPGTPPDRPVRTRVRQALGGTFPDNPVIGVARMDGRFLAITESPWGIAFDPDTLATGERVDLTAGLDCDLTLGHPHYDHDAGAHLNLGVSYGRGATYTLFRRAGGEATPITRLAFEDAPYVHSFGLTERYAVVTAGGFGLDLRALLLGSVTGRTFLDAFERIGDRTRFLVIDRETGALEATAEADPFFVYHHANAYADGNDLVVDLVAFPDERAVTGLTLANLRSDDPDLPAGDLVRFRVPLGGGEASRTRLRRGPIEFPAIHYRRYRGRPYRYVYAAETHGASGLPTDLAKVDVETGRARTWGEPGTFPGEPVFVPALDPDGEDDGALLSVVCDPAEDRSVLVCLDAGSMTERARAPLPHLLPYGFHGQFYGPHDPGRSMC